MQLNIHSLLSNIGELKLLLTKLEQKNSTVDVVLLCETFLSKKTEKLVNIPHYRLYANHRSKHKGGGTAILVRDGILHKRCKDIETMMEKESESTDVEMTAKGGKHIILGSIYKSPNICENTLKNHLTDVLNKIKSEKGNKELVIGMDHNMNLLKSHEHRKTQQFLDLMLEHNLVPTITRPTRITNSTATLIDNIFFSKLLQRSLDSMILLEDISNHLPSLVLMKQTKMMNKEPLNFKSRALNDNKIKCITEELKCKDWNEILRSDNVNVNFDQFCNELNETMDTYAPVKNVRISWKHKFTEPWMNKSIKKASNKCKHLYKKSLSQDVTEADKQKYKEYRNTYNKLKQTVQNEYYTTKCSAYGKNTKQLRRMINSIICKRKHSGSIISYITINVVKTYDANKIVNEFGQYYVTMGADLARKKPESKKKVQEYVYNIPRTLNSLAVGRVEYTDIEKIISALPAKMSSGHDGISNQLLKQLNSSISYPLSIIFNQSLSSGVFPGNMKLAEIVPLIKGQRGRYGSEL